MRNLLATSFAAGTVAVGLLTTQPAHALSITGSANQIISNDSVPINVDVTATDVTGGIQFTLNVNDPTNTGDMLAAYFDFANTFNSAITSVTGVLDWKIGTSNIVGGNIGKTFDLGVQLSPTGSSNGLLTNAVFTVLGTGLDITDLFEQQFAVRLQTAGLQPNGGNGSSKMSGQFPNNAIPTPALLPGLIGMGIAALRKKKKAALAGQENA